MIEQSVSLASNGVVKVPGYEQLVRFGYTKNRSVYRLAVTASGEWEGLTIRAFWHVPDGKDPASSLVVDGYVAVPASVTARPGNGCVTFEGTDGTKTVTSADLRYRVSANSGTEDGTEPEPDTPAWQQLVDAVHADATAAEQAKTDAQAAAKQAGASAKKAGQALSDTIAAKEDALKAIGDKQTAATQAVDTARDEALKRVKASTEAAQTAASEAATSAGNASQSAQEAADSLQELKDGIANGDFKGEKGDTGPQGPKGDVGPAGADGEDGLDAPQIDDTAVTDSAPWSSKHIVDMLCPPLEETGNPVVCYPVAGYPLGCKVSWEPTQEGSGDPSPENIRSIKGKDSVTVERCGENVIEFLSTIDSSENITIATDAEKNITLNGTMVRGGNVIIGKCRLHWVAGKTYTMYIKKVGGSAFLGSGDDITFAYSLFTADFEHFFRGSTRGTNLDAYTASGAALAETELVFMLQCWRSDTVFNNFNFKFEVVPGTTATTAYTPYTGQTAALTLPHTICGGTVDAVTGEGQETWKLVTLDGTGRIYKRDRFSLFELNAVLPVAAKTSAVKASHYSGKVVANGTALYAENANINIGTNVCGFETAEELRGYLTAQYAAGTPVQIAYKPATPIPFTATGAQPIPALSGVNALLTDADKLTVTGRADPIKRITDLEDAVASMT